MVAHNKNVPDDDSREKAEKEYWFDVVKTFLEGEYFVEANGCECKCCILRRKGFLLIAAAATVVLQELNGETGIVDKLSKLMREF